jgi:hypothetical protein
MGRIDFTVVGNQMRVGTATTGYQYLPLTLEARTGHSDTTEVVVMNTSATRENMKYVFIGDYTNVSFGGANPASAMAFCESINAISTGSLGGGVVSSLANLNYPDSPFSSKITANTATQVANYSGFAGWVTIKALSTNGGNVYVGSAAVAAGSGELEPGQSVTYEVADLSTVWVKNIAAGYIVNVFGAYVN